MPTVPRYDTNQVAPTAQPNVRIDAPMADAPTLPDIAGKQLQQFGGAISRYGHAEDNRIIDQMQQANALRVDDALNKAKESALKLTYDKDAGYTNQRGIKAMERESGKPLADEYSETLKKQISDIAGSLGNDAQKQAFAMRSNDLVASFYGGAVKHESEQYRDYALSVREGTINTRMQEIGLNYANQKAIDEAVTSIQAAVYDQSRLLGKSAEWAEAQARKMTSNAHKVALGAALENNDIGYAEGYLKKYSGQMDADDLLRVRGVITKEMNTKVGVGVAVEAITRAQPRIQTSEAERAFNIAVGTESGGQQFAKDGSPLTSPKGAIGIAQVMPGTAPEAAKLAGLPWDENRYKTDANYNKAIGMAYFQKQLQDNGGDLAKAYAAYNAGPGSLQQAVKKAETSAKLAANDPAVPVKTWLDFLPAETRNYVAKNLKEYEAGQGSNPRATFADIDAQLRQDPRLSDHPERYKVARVEAERLLNEQEKARKQHEEDAVANAMQAVVKNGGRYSDLPASIRAQIPPKEIDNVIGFAQKIAKGDDTTSLWLYNKLTGSPDYLANLSDSQFYALRRELSESDFKHFSNERAKRTGAAPGSNGPGDLNSSAIKQTLDERLRMLQIDPSPKDDGGADAARIGGLRRFVDQYFMTAQREAGKKFDDQTVAQHIDALFAKNATFRGWFSNSSGPLLGMKIGDVPGSDKDNIKAAFKRQGIDNPTDAQIMNVFWTKQIARK